MGVERSSVEGQEGRESEHPALHPVPGHPSLGQCACVCDLFGAVHHIGEIAGGQGSVCNLGHCQVMLGVACLLCCWWWALEGFLQLSMVAWTADHLFLPPLPLPFVLCCDMHVVYVVVLGLIAFSHCCDVVWNLWSFPKLSTFALLLALHVVVAHGAHFPLPPSSLLWAGHPEVVSTLSLSRVDRN
jgi:hypothetical protein